MSPSSPCTSPRVKAGERHFMTLGRLNSFSSLRNSTRADWVMERPALDELQVDLLAVEQRVGAHGEDQDDTGEELARGEREADHAHPRVHHVDEQYAE